MNASPEQRLTHSEFAARLTNRMRGNELEKGEAALASSSNLVVVFGASDDLMEFRGAILDEIGACNGTVAYLSPQGELVNFDDGEEEVLAKYGYRPVLHKIEAVWQPNGLLHKGTGDLLFSADWLIKTEIPHSTFDIFDDEEPDILFCRGIVFSLDEFRAFANSQPSATLNS